MGSPKEHEKLYFFQRPNSEEFFRSDTKIKPSTDTPKTDRFICLIRNARKQSKKQAQRTITLEKHRCGSKTSNADINPYSHMK